MQLGRPICIKVIHEEAIVGAGIVAILDGRDDMFASTASPSEAALVVAGRCAQPCDIVIADHGAALKLIGPQGRNRGDAGCRPKILVLTHLDREWDVRVAMEAGVNGYLLQGCTTSQLVDAVGALCVGAKYVSGELASKLADCLLSDELTAREMEVLRAMSTGASNKAISVALGIADATVKAHVRAILSKVGACARTEAVAIATRRGLTGPCAIEPRRQPGQWAPVLIHASISSPN